MHYRIEFTTDDFSPSVRFETLRDPKSADATEGAGLDHQFRFNCGHHGAQEFQHFDLGGHRVEHAPSLRVRTFRSCAMILGLHKVTAALNLAQDAVFLFFFFEEPL